MSLRDQIIDALLEHAFQQADVKPNAFNERVNRPIAEFLADAVLRVVEPALLAAQVDATERADTLAARLAALMDEQDAQRIEQIQAERDAMPEEERRRLDAADAPLLRIQLAAHVRRAAEAKAEAERAADEFATLSELYVSACLRAEQAEAAIARVRTLAEQWENALATDLRYARALRAALDDQTRPVARGAQNPQTTEETR